MLRPTYDRFFVDGQDYTDVLADIDRRSAHIVAGLEQVGRAGPPLRQVLCLLGGEMPSGGPARVRSCHVATLPQLVKLMKSNSRTLTSGDVASVGLALGERSRRPRRE